MLTDIEIAQGAKLEHISKIADQIGLLPEEYEPYGHYKAKITDKFLDRMSTKKDGKLILVTAINPTPAGEGKTTSFVFVGTRRDVSANQIGKTKFDRIFIGNKHFLTKYCLSELVCGHGTPCPYR